MFWVVTYLIVGRLVAPRCRLQSSAPAWVGQHSRLWLLRAGAALAWSQRSYSTASIGINRCVCNVKTPPSSFAKSYVLALAACKTLVFSSLLRPGKRSGAKSRARGLTASSKRPKTPPQPFLLDSARVK